MSSPLLRVSLVVDLLRSRKELAHYFVLSTATKRVRMFRGNQLVPWLVSLSLVSRRQVSRDLLCLSDSPSETRLSVQGNCGSGKSTDFRIGSSSLVCSSATSGSF